MRDEPTPKYRADAETSRELRIIDLRRITIHDTPERRVVYDAAAAADIFRRAFAADEAEQEIVMALYLDAGSRPIAAAEVYRGIIRASLGSPAHILSRALILGAADIIVGHNHPSGDPDPSDEDIAITARMCDAARIVGVGLLDHIIIGGPSHRSIRDRRPELFYPAQAD